MTETDPVYPRALHFQLLRGDTGQLLVSWEGGKLVVVKRLYSIPKEITPTSEDWRGFWEAVEQCGVWSWARRYRSKRCMVLDGTHWHLTLACQENTVESEGLNAFPGSDSITPSDQFNRFLRAIEALAGG
ncbi:MAG: hypothetical protein M1319_06150 [Chloroflexi bacterium]|nr:hypothetical protein [Chloroflexota bacterium]